MSENAVVVKGLRFKIKNRLILDNLDFSVPTGCVFAVVGHNGAGKTSLFHVLLGLKIQTDGEVSIFGKSNLDHHSRKLLGYVAERPYLNLDATLDSFLTYHANLAGYHFSEAAEQVAKAVKSVELGAHLDQELNTFSKGMLQKSLLAQAVIGDPELLILDEPMSGLDPEARESVRKQISNLKQSGKTMIFSSHALDDVEQLADRVMIIKGGKIEFLGTVQEWRNQR